MCRQCQTKPVYEFTNKRKLCRNCFIRWFEKKALYTVRKFSMLDKRDIIKYSNGNDFRNVVLEKILEMIGEKGLVEIVKLPAHSRSQIDKQLTKNSGEDIGLADSKKYRAKRGKVSKIAEPLTTDLVAYGIANEIINGNIRNPNKFLPVYRKVIRPLYLFLDREVLLYAKLRKLRFSPPAQSPKSINIKSLKAINIKNNQVQQSRTGSEKIPKFIDGLEKKHPEVKRAIINGFLDIYE